MTAPRLGLLGNGGLWGFLCLTLRLLDSSLCGLPRLSLRGFLRLGLRLGLRGLLRWDLSLRLRSGGLRGFLCLRFDLGLWLRGNGGFLGFRSLRLGHHLLHRRHLFSGLGRHLGLTLRSGLFRDGFRGRGGLFLFLLQLHLAQQL